MDPFSMLKSLSITGGAAAPSEATSSASGNYVAMNSPFSVAGQGGKANSTATADNGPASINTETIIILALIVGAVLMVLK